MLLQEFVIYHQRWCTNVKFTVHTACCSRWVNYPQVRAALSCSCSLCFGLILCKKKFLSLFFFYSIAATSFEILCLCIYLSPCNFCNFWSPSGCLVVVKPCLRELKNGVFLQDRFKWRHAAAGVCDFYSQGWCTSVTLTCTWSESDSSLGVALYSPKPSSRAVLLPLWKFELWSGVTL